MHLENPGPQLYVLWELEGSCSQDMLKRHCLCFLPKETDKKSSLLLSNFDTNQFSVKILLTMIVLLLAEQFSVDSMKYNKVPSNI